LKTQNAAESAVNKIMPTREARKVSSVVAAGVAALFASVLAFEAAPARAATEAEQAEALIREGVKLRAQDSAALALPKFEQAYQISRSPRTAAQLGLCELELGYWVAADRYLTEALAAPDHPWVAKNKAALKKPLETARANIGELALVLSPANADVVVNHKPLDRALLGAPIRLDKGLVDVEVRAPGYETARETIIVTGGKREERTYALVRAAVAATAGTVPGLAGGGSPSPEGNAAVTLTAPAPAPDGGHKNLRIAAWITGGAALGALVVGTVEAFSAASKRDAFNDHTSLAGGTPYHDCGTRDLSAPCKTLKDDYDQAFTLSIVGFVAAGALAATSSVLFVLSPSGHGAAGERDAGARALTCVPDPLSHGIGCSLRF
jgi:hypothetical protein